MKRLLILIWGVLVFSGLGMSSAMATTYYVDGVNGNDSNDGLTLGTAWLTVHKAGQVMVVGDTTYIRGGTYNFSSAVIPTNSGSAGAYITFQNYQDEAVTLDGGGQAIEAFKLNSAHSYFRIMGLTMQGFGTSGFRTGPIRITRDSSSSPYPHHVEVINCTLRDNWGALLGVKAAHDLIFAGLTLEQGRVGIDLGVKDRGNTYNVQIIDCDIHDITRIPPEKPTIAQDAITAKADWYVVGDEVVWEYWCEDIYITGCEVYNCLDDGMDLYGRHISVEHCIAHDINYGPNYNDCHGFKVYALDLAVDPDRYHTEFTRCLTYNNAREGFKLSSQYAGAPSTNYVKKIRLLNCTGAGDDYGVSLVTNADHPMDVTIKNSLFSSDVGAWEITDNPVIWSEGDEPISSLPGYLTLDSDYNLWYAGIYDPISYLGSLYTLTGWQIESGCDLSSISEDPLLDGNFYPANSSCIDSGTDVGLPYAGSAPDMGVREWGTVAVTSPAGYLKPGENWISIPVKPINAGPYSVFKDLGYWPNCVYHNLYRYDTATASYAEYPTYQSDSLQFGNITPGGAYKLMLAADELPISVEGIEIDYDVVIVVAPGGTLDVCFGNPFNKPIYWQSCQIDNGGTVVSVAQAETNGWIGNVEHFNPVSQSWEAIGAELLPWHAYRLDNLTAGPLDLIMPYPYNISGTVTLEYPGWTQGTAEIMYQVRAPGLPPTAPLYKGTMTIPVTFLTEPYDHAIGDFTITGIPDGTYDVALKHVNHVADMVEDVVISGFGVSQLEHMLWCGDADGDDNVFTVYEVWDSYPSDPEGDNDVDLNDYYTLFYQYQGGLPLTTAYNADFDGDGDIDLADYYGLYYGYQNNPDPGNWY